MVNDMRLKLLTKIAPLATGLILLAGCVIEEPAPPGEPPPPPAPIVETPPPQPDVTFVWVPGEWAWHGRWVWVGGYWGHPPRPGAVWVHGGWAYHGHRRVWVGPHWQ